MRTNASIEPQQYAFSRETGRRIQRDQVVTSFRGEDWFFKSVVRNARGSSSGRVGVARECPDAYTESSGVQTCPHIWHRDGVEYEEFFPSVFELYLGTEDGAEV